MAVKKLERTHTPAEDQNLALLLARQLVVRDATGAVTGLTDYGLQAVEKLAARGSTQNFIATKLNISAKTFQNLLGRADSGTEARLSWERGRARHEQDMIDALIAHGQKNVVGLIFYSKAKLGFRENDAPAEIKNNIVITLPKAPTREEYYKSLGIDGPVDTRTMKNITPTPKQIPQDQPLYSQPTTGDKHHD